MSWPILLSVYAVPHHAARAQTSHNFDGHNVEGHNDDVDLRLSRCRSAHTEDSVRPPVFKIAYAVVPGPCTTPCSALQLLFLMPSVLYRYQRSPISASLLVGTASWKRPGCWLLHGYVMLRTVFVDVRGFEVSPLQSPTGPQTSGTGLHRVHA
jgi:hypothetical protein